jgi:hypothetical protein
MEKIMKRLLLILAILVSNSALAGPEVDSYLSGIAAMDKNEYQVLSDYRDRINTTCSRDVTIQELRAFNMSGQYAKMAANLSTNTAPTAEYSSTLASISCAEFKR